MAEEPGFIRDQYRFAAHIRDPARNPAPAGIDDRRMAVYRELFFNNVASFLASGFPVLRAIHGDQGWTELIRDYFAAHRAHTPLFTSMGREFVDYLASERGQRPGDLPFLAELAHYEWVEMALTIETRRIDWGMADPDGDLLQRRPVLSPLAWPLAYRYPVHAIGPDNLPTEAPAAPTFILVYRDRNDAVGFTVMNPVTARLLELLTADTPGNGRQLLETIAGELHHPDPDVVIAGGLAVLQDLRARDVILGTA